jgi:hypothetical protein
MHFSYRLGFLSITWWERGRLGRVASGSMAGREDGEGAENGKAIGAGQFCVLFFSHSFIWGSHIYIVSVLLCIPTF